MRNRGRHRADTPSRRGGAVCRWRDALRGTPGCFGEAICTECKFDLYHIVITLWGKFIGDIQIYPGPSGKFRPHVDTPRSPRQFGSLVVCLPHPHQGGQLRISHKGIESLWDWSNDGTDKIEWAAFYSDCEHEVLEVQTGHRVTLTYNLYVFEQVGKVIRNPPTALPESYPLHAKVKEILKRPDFLKDGAYPQLPFPTIQERY